MEVKIKNGASRRTKNRFSKFKDQKHKIVLLKQQINETLKGDGFVVGEPMTYFGIDVYEETHKLWKRGWEGWIPDKEIHIIEKENDIE